MPTIDRKPDAPAKPKTPEEIWRRVADWTQLEVMCHWLRAEYRHGGALLDKAEVVALAKKLLCRGLDCEFTKADVEAFLRGE